MQILKSGFADVCVTVPETDTLDRNGIQERYSMNPRKILEGRLPVFLYEGDLVIEKENTLCGMYFQRSEDRCAQLVRCAFGSAYIGIVDLRPESPNYLQSKLFFISSENGKGVYIPRGFAVGYMSASAPTVLVFKMERKIEKEKVHVFSPFDPQIKIHWPAEKIIISAQERYAVGIAEVERIIGEELIGQVLVDIATLETTTYIDSIADDMDLEADEGDVTITE